MKRMFIFIVSVLLLAGPLFAEESVLIDFSILKADIHVRINDNDQGTVPNQNRQTMMDYSQVAGNSFTTQQKAVMKTSLAVNNWEVSLNSSARNVVSIGNSYAQESASKQWGTVMGVRIHFPVEPYNSYAIIKPPFEIPAFEPMATIGDDGSIQPAEGNDGITGKSRFESQQDGQPAYGVVKNVGVIKSIGVNAYGLNFPHSLSTIIIDHDGNQKNIFMGYLNFEGWQELVWNNPAYVQEVRNRELRIYPLYPFSNPFIKFGGFIVQRDASKMGGDFIGYFKDVKVIYDKAVLEIDRDINDESLWHIIYDRETARKVWEMERFGQNQVLRYLEQQKKATEDIFTPTPPTNNP
jgi:hypothetical protein